MSNALNPPTVSDDEETRWRELEDKGLDDIGSIKFSSVRISIEGNLALGNAGNVDE